jgi:protein-S-isoprenylcysteine O-methyltransferase Ste14
VIERILVVVIFLFPVSEVVLAIIKRSHERSAQSEDRGSMLVLWFCIGLGVALAFAAQWIPWARLHVSPPVIHVTALVLMVFGLAVRWTAILTLGRLFTVDVAIHSDHEVVQAGLYRLVRHPSYTGLLIAFLGFGVYFANWLSMIALLVPIVLGMSIRVRQEEKALLRSLGPAYAAYCARTKRFIPGLF